MSQGSSSRTWWLVGGAALLIIALLAIALSRGPVQLDPNTPEGTVQNYLQAVSDSDYEGAFNLIDSASTEGCSPADLAAAAPGDPFTAALGESEITGGFAFVDVTMRFGAAGRPLDPGAGGYTEYFELSNDTGQWLLTGPVWPYFDWRCEGP